ncbi:MAG: hypothetical protein GYA62_04565 [Bacteroidales bacterium]|nr:hypothetical protein [Bacteroidales bacterium]
MNNLIIISAKIMNSSVLLNAPQTIPINSPKWIINMIEATKIAIAFL